MHYVEQFGVGVVKMIPETVEDHVKLANLRFNRELFGAANLPTDDGLVIGFPDHPTLIDIANRELEMADWDRLRAQCMRQCRGMFWGGGLAAIVCLAAALLFMDITLWVAIPAFVGVIFFSLVFCCGCEALYGEDIPYYPECPRPEPLQLVPFSAGENRVLISEQAPEIFLSGCACPGCGDVDVHLLRTAGPGDPEWANVIRTCKTCQREWAQV
ncbi:hypothetical protein MINTM005_13630 [Mycobacterium intracellulare]|uniref:hypothetical protein n=1 Tax=Mycobacterium intracellulare TaxID=1767 RepID=UPI00192576B0|nr:hypothetical protein [Mycobacterium intracellulare]BCO56119.1 hypothetical protein MINTM005_13630 [Mycobacterium intracellulare]